MILILLSVVSLLTSSVLTSPATPVLPYDVANAIITYFSVLQTLQTHGSKTLRNDNNTATSSRSSLVRPNANYVYTAMAIDLSSENVIITIPNITDGRSYVYPFYDLYGDMVAALGSATNSPPGEYLLRHVQRPRQPGLTMLDPNLGFPYQGIIDFPGVYGSMDARILLRNNGSDLDALHRDQSEVKVTTMPRSGSSLAPPLTPSLLGNGLLGSAALSNPRNLDHANSTAILSLLAKLAPYNPPQDEYSIPEVKIMLQGAGIVNGSYIDQGFDQNAVTTLINQRLNRTFPQNHIYWNELGQDWWNYKSYISGAFHQAYGVRAETAYTGYLEMTYTEALYPEYLTGQNESLALSANESYIITFFGRPPAQFWSVTFYRSDNYLVPNKLQRYNLGCTSETITYANGTKVYPTGQHNDQYFLSSQGDEAFQILVQPADKAPPSNWTGNWLPAQAGGGLLTVNFRTYGPSPALTNGSYTYPAVSKQGLFQ